MCGLSSPPAPCSDLLPPRELNVLLGDSPGVDEEDPFAADAVADVDPAAREEELLLPEVEPDCCCCCCRSCSRRSLDSWWRHFIRRFWNQTFTWMKKRKKN